MKDIRSLLLALFSVGLVATWVYHFYDKANYSQLESRLGIIDSAAIRDNIRDSLQKAYSATINDRDFKLDSSRNTSDSLRALLNERISEIEKLKGEIGGILKNPNSSSSQLKEARKKMAELEEKVGQLRNQNSSMEVEKQTLSAKLDQVSGEVTSLEQNMRKLDDENKDLKEKIKQASVFMASALHLTAIDVRDTNEKETAQSKKADKFVASFVLQNNLNQYLNAEVFVIVTGPDGKVLQSSTWDSGTFDTKTEGKKSFTRRVKFDYEKSEQKRLIFSLDADSFQKGTYTLQVWHQGVLIGEATRNLH